MTSIATINTFRFEPAYPLSKLQPASYNPRRITDDAFVALRASLAKFGVCKPVILNADGTLVAGHQRTKALKANGATTVPAIILSKKVRLQDEIRFNLFHNAIETDRATVRLTRRLPIGYATIPYTEIDGQSNAAVAREIVDLIVKYGPWGSVVATPEGQVILNSDYARAAQIARVPLLVYTMPADQIPGFLAALDRDYGSYHFDSLGVKAYNQLRCQMMRLRQNVEEGRTWQIRSTLYESCVLPNIKPGERLFDFGAGQLDYVKKLQKSGHPALGYEPHLQAEGSRSINVRGVVQQLDAVRANVVQHGLFPHVVLDSVLNSVTSMEFEDWVLTACNAFTAADGTFYAATRNLENIDARARAKTSSSRGNRGVQFLDENNFSATFREGVWTLQHFHTPDGLVELLSRYFGDVKLAKTKSSGSALQAVCRRPLPLGADRYRKALDVELNMEYPNGYRHNRHEVLRDVVLELVKRRDGG